MFLSTWVRYVERTVVIFRAYSSATFHSSQPVIHTQINKSVFVFMGATLVKQNPRRMPGFSLLEMSIVFIIATLLTTLSTVTASYVKLPVVVIAEPVKSRLFK